jgi:uncharacterized protein (DUF2062 family)
MKHDSTTADATDATPFAPAVIALAGTDGAGLLRVLDRVKVLRLPLFVVSDGSPGCTMPLLADWLEAHQDGCTHVLTCPASHGVGGALQAGFAAARELGYTHAATLKADGQLDPEDIRNLLAAARAQPQALVLGYRNERVASHREPPRSSRRFGNLGVRMTCGRHVRDSQCSLRVYPLDLMGQIRCRANRYGYESEIITRAAWAGLSIVECPVSWHCPPEEQRAAHCMSYRETFRLLRRNLVLMARELLPWPHQRLISPTLPPPRQRLRSSFKDWMSWLSPLELWRQVRHDAEDRMSIAAGVTLGAFIACLPAYGYQTILAIYMSRRLHLHPVAAILGTNLSTPPIGQGIWLASIWLGHLLTAGQWLRLSDLDFSQLAMPAIAGRLLLEWVLGSVLIGLALAPPAFLTTLWALKLVPVKAESGTDPEA